MLYFAYGSNVDGQRVTAADRCPNARYIFNALLPGHRLVFSHRTDSGSGAADLTHDPTSSVWGVVYDITDSDRKQLDSRDVVSHRASRPKEVLVHPHGDKDQRVMVVTYGLFDSAAQQLSPARDYMERIIQAARHRGFPAEYISQLQRIKTL